MSLSIVFGFYDSDDHQISTLKKLTTDCIDEDTPTRHVKLTRPIAAWIKYPSIVQTQKELEEFRIKARDTSNIEERRKYQDNRNQ